MEKKTLHVVSGLSYRATLKNGLAELGIKDDIVYLPIDLSLHYIPKDFSDTELMQSAMSLNILGLELQEKMVVFNQLKEFVTTDYSNYEKVIVWHGWSAYELLLLYLMTVLVDDNLYHIDITTCEDFMKEHPSLPYLDMGYVSPYDVYTFNMPSFAKPVTDKEKIEYTNQWNRWKNSTAPYRFSNIYTGVINEYPVDFMDKAILKYAKNESKFIILVGKVHKEFDCLFISDSIVFNRILELYWEHKLDLFVSLREGSPFVFNLQLDSKKTFLNFIESKNNKVARTMGLSIADNPGQTTCNPYFIFGPNGCGKTHLINAIGISCTEKDPQKQVLYVSAQQFQREFTDSVRQNTTNDFIDYYHSIDVLIVDDIQEWVKAPKTVDAFFQIFNQLLRNGKQIILASDRPPVDLKGMEEYVVKCFACGLVVEIEMPDLQLCIDILNAMCKQDGLEISAEVSEYISRAVNGSVCDLEGITNSLIAYAKVNSSNIDMELAKRMISNFVNLKKQSV